MDRDEALKLLRGRERGVKEWNRRRDEEFPDFSGADLSRTDLRSADLSGANLSGANLSGANLVSANFSRASLHGADLRGASLSGANLGNAELSDANLRNVNLRNVTLVDVTFDGANLGNADLSDVSLSGVDLSRANLSRANLSRADLSGANLRGTNLRGANLRDANLCGALLLNADFSGANVGRINLKLATAAGTAFVNLDLSEVHGLDQVKHGGPSSLGTDTLSRSNGKIPDDFLRRCGLSPWEVEMARLYDPELTAHEVVEIVSTNLYSKRTVGPLYLGGVFISYSHSEKGFADKLRKRLHDAGASVWLDRHDAVAGNLNKQIQREIRLRDIVVLILSDTSVKSDWVEHELKSTRAKEKDEKRDVLCPVCVDDSWKSQMDNPNWSHLSDKLILDFSSWKTKAFHKQFDRLLKGMKINYEVRK